MSNEPIYKQVMKDVEVRAEVGKKTYGRYLMEDVNGRNPLQDAYEEQIDGAKYLKQAIHERRALIEYVARLEGGFQKILDTLDEGDSMSWYQLEAVFAEILATSPLSGQPQPAPPKEGE